MRPAIETLGIPESSVFTDYRQCMQTAKPDLVILCPPTGEHAEGATCGAREPALEGCRELRPLHPGEVARLENLGSRSPILATTLVQSSSVTSRQMPPTWWTRS